MNSYFSSALPFPQISLKLAKSRTIINSKHILISRLLPQHLHPPLLIKNQEISFPNQAPGQIIPDNGGLESVFVGAVSGGLAVEVVGHYGGVFVDADDGGRGGTAYLGERGDCAWWLGGCEGDEEGGEEGDWEGHVGRL